jgi:pectate lyase
MDTAGSPPLGGGPQTAGEAGMPSAGEGGAAGDPNLLLADDFESGSSRWLEVSGAPWSVALDAERASNGYQLSPVSELYVAIAKDGKWADKVIAVKVKVLAFGGTGTGDVVSIIGRFSNLDNYYAAVLRPDGRVAIRARVAGAPPASIKTSVDFGVAANTWYQLRFELVGTLLRLYIDDALRVEATDDRIANGTVALGGENSAAIFDDVRVTRP